MYYSPTAVKVTWEILNNNRTISGYKLHIVETGSSREPPLAPFEKIIKIQNASQTSLVIFNLSIFTRYQIRMAAYSYKEVGDFSFSVIAGRLIFFLFFFFCMCPYSQEKPIVQPLLFSPLLLSTSSLFRFLLSFSFVSVILEIIGLRNPLFEASLLKRWQISLGWFSKKSARRVKGSLV